MCRPGGPQGYPVQSHRAHSSSGPGLAGPGLRWRELAGQEPWPPPAVAGKGMRFNKRLLSKLRAVPYIHPSLSELSLPSPGKCVRLTQTVRLTAWIGGIKDHSVICILVFLLLFSIRK